MGSPYTIIKDWHSDILYWPRKSISGVRIPSFTRVNIRKMEYFCKGAYVYNEYATDKELFELKLRGNA